MVVSQILRIEDLDDENTLDLSRLAQNAAELHQPVGLSIGASRGGSSRHKQSANSLV